MGKPFHVLHTILYPLRLLVYQLTFASNTATFHSIVFLNLSYFIFASSTLSLSENTNCKVSKSRSQSNEFIPVYIHLRYSDTDSIDGKAGASSSSCFSFQKVNEAKRTQQEYYEMELKNLQNRLEGEVAQLNEAHGKTLEELARKHHMAIEAVHSNASRDKIKLQTVSANLIRHYSLNCRESGGGPSQLVSWKNNCWSFTAPVLSSCFIS